MDGRFWFAWTGGDPIPAFALDTTGDLWSGSWATMGTVWGGSLATTGDILSDGLTIANLLPRTGLVAGQVYGVTGGGIAGPAVGAGEFANGQKYTILSIGTTDFTKIGSSSNLVGATFTATGVGAGSGSATIVDSDIVATWLTYLGDGGGRLSQAATVAEGVSLTLWAAGAGSVILEDASALEPGTDYGIAGGGIPAGTRFTFSGSNTITLSQPATATGFVQLTITNPNGKNLVKNLADVTGLIAGFTYEVFGLGLPAGVEGIYGGTDRTAIWAAGTNVNRTAGAVTIMGPGTAVGPGYQMFSPSGEFLFAFQTDGNLVLYQYGTPLWSSRTNGEAATALWMQTDGNLVLYDGATPIWASGTNGKGSNASLVLQNDGNLVIYADGGSSFLLLADATKSGRGVGLAISKGKTYPDGGAFDPVAHVREDEAIIALEISHEEGNFPSLKIDVLNPRIGLLAAGRNLWCWLSYGPIEAPVPLFHGRLIGIPANLQEEVVTLQFVARPNDYQARKSALAETLKVRPFWDPIWISQGESNPDTVLEARPQSWHIDRTTLAVTVSDILVGEDGTLALTAADHLYDGMEVSYADTPLRRVSVRGLVSWTQAGTGTVDLTNDMVEAFREGGSPYYYPLVSSFTGPGLFDAWPKPGTSIGAGWSVDASATIEIAGWAQPWLMPKAYLKPSYQNETILDAPGTWVGGNGLVWRPAITHSSEVIASWETWAAAFILSPYALNFVVSWTAARPRTETVEFVIDANVQPLLTDPADTEVATIDLSSALVAEAVDPGDQLPIGDLRRNSYFNTDRGAQSIEFLVALARAKLLARGRAVQLKVVTPFDFGVGLSCRWNVQVLDARLPGGEATGKVTNYVLSASGDSGRKAEITLGCSVGYGNVVTPDPGHPTYVDDHVDGYQRSTGATLDPGTGDVVYQSLDDLDVLDDDGIDLFNMTASRVLRSIRIDGGVSHQQATLGIFPDYTGDPLFAPATDILGTWAQYVPEDDPSTVLGRDPTIVSLDLVPIGGQAFETDYVLAVSALSIPQTINTEAA